jgi:hypothetical protein
MSFIKSDNYLLGLSLLWYLGLGLLWLQLKVNSEKKATLSK